MADMCYSFTDFVLRAITPRLICCARRDRHGCRSKTANPDWMWLSTLAWMRLLALGQVSSCWVFSFVLFVPLFLFLLSLSLALAHLHPSAHLSPSPFCLLFSLISRPLSGALALCLVDAADGSADEPDLQELRVLIPDQGVLPYPVRMFCRAETIIPNNRVLV